MWLFDFYGNLINPAYLREIFVAERETVEYIFDKTKSKKPKYDYIICGRTDSGETIPIAEARENVIGTEDVMWSIYWLLADKGISRVEALCKNLKSWRGK